MRAKNPGRYLAPVALIAVAVAVLLIVLGRGHRHHVVATPPVRQATVASHVTHKKKSFYVIKPGDSLSRISVKTGVPIATLEALNPSIDPNALQTGQRIRLRR